MKTPTFQLQPIDPADADQLRATGGPVYVADTVPGFPCRQCLKDAEIGEEMILVSHDPFNVDSPYRCASPVFLHLQSCAPRLEEGGLPSQLTIRDLSVRALDDQSFIIDATVIPGTELGNVLERMFEDPRAESIHIHNAARGCWATTAKRTRSI